MAETKPPPWERTAHFVDRESGIMSRVTKVDEAYAYIEVLQALPSGWAMPVSQYDTRWSHTHTPVDMGSMKVPEKYRPPLDVSGWVERSEPQSALDKERGETHDGVRIGDEFTWREPRD